MFLWELLSPCYLWTCLFSCSDCSNKLPNLAKARTQTPSNCYLKRTPLDRESWGGGSWSRPARVPTNKQWDNLSSRCEKPKDECSSAKPRVRRSKTTLSLGWGLHSRGDSARQGDPRWETSLLVTRKDKFKPKHRVTNDFSEKDKQSFQPFEWTQNPQNESTPSILLCLSLFHHDRSRDNN